MPTNKKTTTTKTNTKNNKSAEANKNTITQTELEAQYAKLMAMQNELQEKLNQINSMNILQVSSEPEEEKISTNEYEYKEINPNRKTRVYSLCFGFLSLHCPHCGFTEFKDYGSFKVLSYAQLSDYMLTCSEVFKNGTLYIVDPEIVDSLGLSSYYENLFSVELVDRLLRGEQVDYNQITVSSEDQKNSLAKYVALKVYNEEFKDFNAIAELSKACGRDIMADVNQMKEISRNMEANE